MKKFCLIFLLIAIFFSCFINVYSAELPDTLDIGVYFGSTAKESVLLETDGKTFTVNASDITEDTEYTSENEIVGINTWLYHGSIILKKDSNGLLTVINRVPTEQYIASVLGKEMSYSFEMEALKTQAVCARTYAAKNMGKHQKYGFDICDTIDCQVYTGISSEHENTIKAAKETEGELLFFEDELAQTVYFASSGGHTESAEYVWGTRFPYLTAVPDEFESEKVYGHSWTATYTADELTKIFDERGYGVGRVTNIEPTKVTENGTVYELVISGTEGEKVLKRESCRTFLGAKLLSQAYTVTPEGKANTLYTTSGTVSANSINVISASGEKKLAGKSIPVITSKGTTSYAISKLIDSYTFNGRGYGHLVGMSQNGANAMAKEGYDYEEILTHYYQGTHIKRPDNNKAISTNGL